MKCLEKDRARRYETGNGLAMDLRRYLDDEPVVARPPSRAYRLQRFIQRNRLAVAAGLPVAAALAFGTVTSLREARHARRALQTAEASEHRAKAAQAGEAAARRQAEAHAYASDMRLAQQELARNNLGGSLALLDPFTQPRFEAGASLSNGRRLMLSGPPDGRLRIRAALSLPGRTGRP